MGDALSLAFLAPIIRYAMPASWLAAVAVNIFERRSETTRALAIHSAVFFVSGVATRLAVDHHESRVQIAGFMIAAGALELGRSKVRDETGSAVFWTAASVASALGVAAARPIAHRYAVSTW